MSGQVKESLHGDFTIEGYYKTTTAHGFVNASSEYLATSVSKRFFVANRKYRVKAANLTITVAGTDSGAVTADIYKVPSGTAIASGTSILSGTVSLKGTADTNNVLTLTTTTSVLDMDKGDALAVVFSGTMTAATGVASVSLTPM